MSKPYVSVLIDTYNHERFIEQAITSVLEQDMSMSDVEIVVVDDGSTDRTPEIVRKFEPRLRLVRKPNGGQASAFNTGIPECHGEIIAFLDGDDWWAPEKLRRVVETMEGEPEVGIVGHGYAFAFPDGRRQLHVLREGFRFRANTLEGALLLRVRGAFLGTSRIAIRASVLQQVLPVPETITIQADEYLSTVAAALSEVRILPEPLFYYRMHDSNAYQILKTDLQRLRRKQKVLAELARHLDGQLRIHGLVDGGHDAARDERLDDVAALDVFHLLAQLLHGHALRERDLAGRARVDGALVLDRGRQDLLPVRLARRGTSDRPVHRRRRGPSRDG